MQNPDIVTLRDCNIEIGETRDCGSELAVLFSLEISAARNKEFFVPESFFSVDDRFYPDELPTGMEIPQRIDAEGFINWLKANALCLRGNDIHVLIFGEEDKELVNLPDREVSPDQTNSTDNSQVSTSASFWPEWTDGETPPTVR